MMQMTSLERFPTALVLSGNVTEVTKSIQTMHVTTVVSVGRRNCRYVGPVPIRKYHTCSRDSYYFNSFTEN